MKQRGRPSNQQTNKQSEVRHGLISPNKKKQSTNRKTYKKTIQGRSRSDPNMKITIKKQRKTPTNKQSGGGHGMITLNQINQQTNHQREITV